MVKSAAQATLLEHDKAWGYITLDYILHEAQLRGTGPRGTALAPVMQARETYRARHAQNMVTAPRPVHHSPAASILMALPAVGS